MQKPIVDIYPYYGVWMVHHQVDWAIAKYLETNKLADVRVFTCSHLGQYNCAVSRDFSVVGKGNPETKILEPDLMD